MGDNCQMSLLMKPTHSIAIAAVLAACGATPAIQTAFADPPNEETLPTAAVARLGAHRFVHHDRIDNLAFSPDGSTLFSVSSEKACLWDIATGRKRRTWRLNSSIMCGALSKDGQTAVLAENGPTIHVFNAVTGQQTAQLSGSRSRSHAVALSTDGRRVASGDGPEVVLWEVTASKERRRWKQGGEFIAALRFSPDGERLAVAEDHGEMWIHHLDGRQPPVRLEGGTGFRAWLVFSPRGGMLAGSCDIPFPGGHRSSLRFWSSTTGKMLQEVPGSFDGGQFSPDGKSLVASGLGAVCVYDTATGDELHRLPDCHQHVWSVALSPDGKTLANAQGQRVRLWNTDTWQEIGPGSGHSEPVQAVAFSPDGRTIATGGLDGSLIQWAWPEAREQRRIEGIGSHWGVEHLTFSPDGHTLAATAWINYDDTFFLFDAATGAPISRFGKDHQGRGPVAFLPGGPEVLTAGPSDGSLAVWDAASGRLLRSVGKRRGRIHALQPMPGTGTAWWAGEFQGLGLRDLKTGEDLRVLTGGSHDSEAQLAVSPDGHWLAVGNRVWDVKTGEVVAEGGDTAAAISPDGRLLASVKNGIVFWEALTRQEIYTVGVDMGQVNALAFSPDGTVLAAAGYADTLIWDMTGRLRNGRLSALEPTQAEMESLWQRLGGDDAWAAHQAAWALAAAGKAAVQFLAHRLRPAPIPDPLRIETLRARLADPDYDARELAARKLLDLGLELRPEQREALRRPDTRYAIAQSALLDFQHEPEPRLLPPPELLPLPERLRSSRAVAALERSKAPAAAESLLESLADGAPQAPLTREAKAALARVRLRH